MKLRPEAAGFYINRAYLRYMNDDIHGAFEDYDRAIGLEPANTAAIFNRGLLRAEVHDTNRAIDDFSRVLDLDCEDYKDALQPRHTPFRNRVVPKLHWPISTK